MQTQSEPRALLEVDQLEIWRGERRLIHGLSFSARPGELVHLKGPNGSGKTSLLRCLAGLSLPDDGAISWFGRRYTGRIGAEARAQCRYLGHQDALKSGLDLAENLRALQALHGDSADVNPMLEAAGLENRFGVAAARLSAGQRRRGALARMPVSNARAWLLDEPFNSLDANGIALIACWIAALLSAGGIAVLSTHQPLPEPLRASVIELGDAA
ncbi:MAG TPA: heme ABC exporter ATP-binding protein CcmA [Gammaproteobacteria bacterium]